MRVLTIKRRCKRASIFVGPILLGLLLYLPLPAEEKTAVPTNPAERLLWREPIDIHTRDLIYGSGGAAHAPAPGPFAFIEEDTDGSSPKVVLRDSRGVEWKVKLGKEARGETAASRLVWAAGYFTDDDYFLPRIEVDGTPANLARGGEFISADGRIMWNVRLERQPEDRNRIGEWKWKDDSWTGRQDFNGLRALMALLNNWDLKDSNTAVYAVEKPAGKTEYLFAVADLGASFGAPNLQKDRTKADLEDYAGSRFIRQINGNFVDFETPGQPTIWALVNLPHYFDRKGMKEIGRDIPRTDARWMGQLLSQLSAKQIRDAFRAGGFSPEEVEGFARVVETRIRMLAEI